MDDTIKYYKRICAAETLYSRKKGFCHEMIESVKQAVGLEYILNTFVVEESDDYSLSKMLKNFKINKIINDTLNKKFLINSGKSGFISKKYRIQSVQENNAKKFFTTLQLLNNAVRYAPEIGDDISIDDGFTLPLSFITRADVLLKYHEYYLAHEELKNIIKLKIPFIDTSKIFEKILFCRHQKSNLSFEKFKSTRPYDMKVLFQENNNLTVPMSNLVKIKTTKSAGKEATANFLINPGDVLVVEKPVASCLKPNFYDSFCENCFRRFKINYSCPVCSIVNFCSYSCRNKAVKTFHVYECKIIPFMIDTGASVLCLLALRLITQLGLEKCLKLFRTLSEGIVTDEFENYLELYKLEKHSSCREVTDHFERKLMTTFLLQCLKKTDFFNITSPSQQLHFHEFIVSSLLLTHLEFLQFNAYEIYAICQGNELYVQRNINMMYIGVGIYPNASRFNHNCYPSTTRCFNGNVIILRSNRLLQENEIVAENYGPIFLKKSLLERRRYLSGRYWFHCNCEACKDDWPLISKIPYNQIKIRCKSNSCRNYINVYFDFNIQKIYHCEECLNLNYFTSLHQNIIKKCIIWYAHGITVMDQYNMEEALQIILPALKTFHHVASVPHRFTHLTEMSLQYCLMHI